MDVYAYWAAWALNNFALSMLALAVLFIIVDAVFHREVPLAEICFRWLALFPFSVTSIYAFMMQAFFPEFTAASLGWPMSPFQYEVAVADLAFCVLGVMSYNTHYHFRLATVIGFTIWSWGGAFNSYLHQIGYDSAFWVDLILPLLLLLSVFKLRHVK